MSIYNAWLAGFMDGESNISFVKNKHPKTRRLISIRVDVNITQSAKHRHVLEDIQRVFGGHIYLKKPTKLSSKPCLSLAFYRQEEVVKLLNAVLSHLRIKKTKAELALKHIGTPKQNFTEINRAKTHCLRGHEFTIENTVIRPNGKRRCKICTKIHHQTAQAKIRAKKLQQGF